MNNLERLEKIKCFLFDMDGTINLGDTLISGMEGFFEKLKMAGIDYYLLTNNSSKNHEHYVEKMNRLGVPVVYDNILISSDAFTNYMIKNNPQAKLFVLGTPQLKETIIKAGLVINKTLEEKTDMIVVGFDMTLDYEKLALACRLIDKGTPYVATHPDVKCPIENGEFIPDCGAILEFIKTATGKKPQMIFGKPYRYMVDVVLDKTGYKKEEIAMVGDRLSTDIAFGLNNNILSVMVLTGEATMKDVEQSSFKPDIILPHAAEILKYLR